MKLSRKLILTLALVLSVAMATTGTLAYLTDSESEKNIFTVGEVDIILEEEFEEPSELLPNVTIEKSADITNVGKNNAFVWGTVAVPYELKDVLHVELNTTDANWDWNTISGYEDVIDGHKCWVYTGLYQEVLTKDATTSDMLTSVKLDEFVERNADGTLTYVRNGVVDDLDWDLDGNDGANSKPVIFVSAYAMQSEGVYKADGTAGGVKDAYNLYTQQWGDPTKADDAGVAIPVKNEFIVQNSDELQAALDEIHGNSEYWNRDIAIKMADGVYAGDFVIKQYPEGPYSSVNGSENVTRINFSGSNNVTFNGTVTVNGFGNGQSGFANANAATTFKNINFDSGKSIEVGGPNIIVVKMAEAANNVTFNDCEFNNATHITTGSAGKGTSGTITFNKCLFNDGGCLSGSANNIIVQESTVTAASNGFINNACASAITVESSEINAGKYFLRSAEHGSGIHMTVTNSPITMYESEGECKLVNYRGDATNCTAVFTNCGIDETTYLSVTTPTATVEFN